MNLDSLIELADMPSEYEVKAIRDMPDAELRFLDETSRRFDRMGERARFELRRRKDLQNQRDMV